MARQLKYDQACLAILDIIATGSYDVGSKLPGELKLLKMLPNYTLITLRRALSILVDTEVIERRHGSGTYVKQKFTSPNRCDKVLFINIVKEEDHGLPNANNALGRMINFFEIRGIEFVYLSETTFNNRVVQLAHGAQTIMLYGWVSDEWANQLKCLNIPLLIVGNSENTQDIPQVKYDLARCIESLTHQLIDAKCKKFAIFNAPTDYFVSKEIYKYVFKNLLDANIEQPEILWSTGEDKTQLLLDNWHIFEENDAVIIETGIYMALLGVCASKRVLPKATLGVVPILADQEILSNSGLFVASENVFLGVTKNSVFDAANEIVMDKLLGRKEFKPLVLIS